MPTQFGFPVSILLGFVISFTGSIYAEPPPARSDAVPQEIQKALQLPEGDERTRALVSAGMAWERQDPHAAMEWAFNLTNNKSSFEVVRAMSNDWGEREPVPATTAWVMSHSPKSGQLTLLALHLIATAWARHDPPAAILWAEKQPVANDLRRTAYYSAADGWVQKDPEPAAAWAEKLPDEADRHVALGVVAGVWVGKWRQPEIAAAWAEKLPVADMKYAVPRLAGAWAMMDAAKARAWVSGLPLADTDKAEILGKMK